MFCEESKKWERAKEEKETKELERASANEETIFAE